MNCISTIMKAVVLFLFICLTNLSEGQIRNAQATTIEPYPLKITSNKTTNIILPYAIKSVDRGSADVLAQKAKGVENILLVKAARENFSETNLSVVTADGRLYSFLINYTDNPSAINISFITDTPNTEVPNSLKSVYNQAEFQTDADNILKEKKKIHNVRDYRHEMQLSLDEIYIKDDVVFFKLEVANNSNINYDVDMLRFFIMDEKKAKRTASQEIEIHPLFVEGDTMTIKGHEKNILVFALPKFTIPDKKYLSVQLTEKNGGRDLELSVANKKLIKAELIK